MALAYWRDNCKTSHPQIDDEHHEILIILKQLYQKVILKESDDVIRSTLDTLFTAFLDHSETEEALMRQYSYPEIRAHIDDHEVILSKVFNLRLQAERHGLNLNKDIAHDLANCINKHVWEYDLAMVQYIQSEGYLYLPLDRLDQLSDPSLDSRAETAW